MTSIHAGIPSDMKAAALAARTRGDVPSAIRDEIEQRPVMRSKSSSSSSVVMKKLPQRLTSTRSAPNYRSSNQHEEETGSEEDEKSASKENDPSLSPSPVATQSPRRPSFPKRPLSDLPCPTDPEDDSVDPALLSHSEQNIANSMPPPPAPEPSRKGSQLIERNAMVNFTGRGLQGSVNSSIRGESSKADLDDSMRPAKRICSDEAKENALAGLSRSGQPMPVQINSVPAKVQSAGARKASAPGSLGGGKGGKARVGLRRL